MTRYYLFGSRILTHVAFWASYYLLFGFIWAKEGNYVDSYFLEFVLLPVRMVAVYATIYWLIPKFLKERRYREFIIGIILLLVTAGVLQRIFMYFFYEFFTGRENLPLFSLAAIGRSIILINSTVLFVSALKILQLWERDRHENQLLKEKNPVTVIEIKADKRIHRVNLKDIIFLESQGNYVVYHLAGRQLMSYISLNDAVESLPDNFVRIHKSYVINKNHVVSYNHENIEMPDKIIPIGRQYKMQYSV